MDWEIKDITETDWNHKTKLVTISWPSILTVKKMEICLTNILICLNLSRKTVYKQMVCLTMVYFRGFI